MKVSSSVRLSYIVIPAIALVIAFFAKMITASGMVWYKGLTLPAITPPGYVFSFAWQLVYVCTTAAAVLAWDAYCSQSKDRKKLYALVLLILFILNAALNLLWVIIFFKWHNLSYALFEAIALQLTVIAIIVLGWFRDARISILMLPYFIWLSFAIYINYYVYALNKTTYYLFKWLF